jgi:hypothetical protein
MVLQCRPACLRNVLSGMTTASCSLVSAFAARRVWLLPLHAHRSHLRSYNILRTDHKVRNQLWYRVCSVTTRRVSQNPSEVSEMNRNNGSAYLQVCLCRGYELKGLDSPLLGPRADVASHANTLMMYSGARLGTGHRRCSTICVAVL